MNGYIALIHYPLDSLEWLVSFPDLPECRSAGRSLDEAVVNARLALTDHLTFRTMTGEAVPAARSPGEMLLAANDDPALACRMVGAVLKAIEPEPAAALRLAVSNVAVQYGFYGEERPRRRHA